jgi:hypothetical protein
VEIRYECSLGDKGGWRYKEWHKIEGALYLLPRPKSHRKYFHTFMTHHY